MNTGAKAKSARNPQIARQGSAIEELRDKVAEMYVQHYTYREIGAKLGISIGQVCQHMKIVVARWKDRAEVNVGHRIEEECKKLDVTEREARAAWEKSKADAKARSKVIEGVPGAGGSVTPRTVRVTEHTEEQYGDPRYLEVILKCQERRAKLLGIDVTKVEHSGEVEVTKIIYGGDPAEAVK